MVLGASGTDGESGADSLFFGGEEGITPHSGGPVAQGNAVEKLGRSSDDVDGDKRDRDDDRKDGDRGRHVNMAKFGAAVVAGDFNGDRVDDLAVGAPGKAPGGGPSSGGRLHFLRLGGWIPPGLLAHPGRCWRVE